MRIMNGLRIKNCASHVCASLEKKSAWPMSSASPSPVSIRTGLIRFTPWEAVVVAADVAMKSADVEIGFMDRFCGSLILTGRLSEVQTAVEEVVRFFREELHFHTCEIHRS